MKHYLKETNKKLVPYDRQNPTSFLLKHHTEKIVRPQLIFPLIHATLVCFIHTTYYESKSTLETEPLSQQKGTQDEWLTLLCALISTSLAINNVPMCFCKDESLMYSFAYTKETLLSHVLLTENINLFL